MRNKKIIISTVILTLLSTGCVKPTEEVNTAQDTTNTSDGTVVYTEEPTTTTYEGSSPIVYSDPTTDTPSNNNVIYGTSTGVDDGTIVATDHYQPAVGSSSSSSSMGNGAYGVPSSTSSSGGDIYNSVDDPYTTTGLDTYSNNNHPYSTTSNSSYHTNSHYTTNRGYSTSSGHSTSSGYSTRASGIELQVAAFSNYYSAQEFKNNLSLDPKYNAYIKKGAMNKVIIKGFSSRSEAKALAARQFPGAFIVSGSSSSSSYSSTPSYSGGNSSYNSNSSYSSQLSNSVSGIGIQVGAFSSKSRARSVAQSKAGGKYTAIVKTAKVRGRTIYKAIILGFSSRAEAKRAIATGRFGNAFVVSVQ